MRRLLFPFLAITIGAPGTAQVVTTDDRGNTTVVGELPPPGTAIGNGSCAGDDGIAIGNGASAGCRSAPAETSPCDERWSKSAVERPGERADAISNASLTPMYRFEMPTRGGLPAKDCGRINQ